MPTLITSSRKLPLPAGRLWLGLAGTGAFLGLFFWRTDLPGLADALSQADYWWALPAVAIWFVSAWVRAIRWRYLLRSIADLKAVALYPTLIIGYMANNLLPLRTGELVRAYVLGERHGISKASALATIAVERAFDGIILVSFLAVAGAFLGLNGELRALALTAAGAFAALFALLLYFASSPARARGWVERLVRHLPPSLGRHAQALTDSCLQGLQALQSPALVALVLAASVAAWLLESLMYYLIGLSFHIDEAFPTYLMVAGAANLATGLPSTSGGIGPFEVLAKETLTFLGVGSAVAGGYAVALHGLLLLPVIVAGLLCMWAVNFSLGRTLRSSAGGAVATPTAASAGAPQALAEQPE